MSQEKNFDKSNIDPPNNIHKTITLLGLAGLVILIIGVWSSINTFILRELRSSILSIIGSIIALIINVSILSIVLTGIKGKSVKYKILICGGGATLGIICFGLLLPVLYK